MIIIPNVEKEDSCLNCPVWSLCWDNEPTEDISKDRCPIVDLAVGAIKAEPKHGRWLVVKVMDDEADFGETDGAECSACGYTTINEYWAKTYYHYCPNCGARMYEVEE